MEYDTSKNFTPMPIAKLVDGHHNFIIPSFQRGYRWEKKQVTVKELGESLFLDSGTLTPLLKKMEQKQLLTRTRSKEDERVLLVTITEEGEALKEKAVNVPTQLMNCITIDPEDAEKLYELLYKALGGMA